MGKFVNYVTPLHKATTRAYIDRMVDDKVHCMLKAKEYEADYWDGDRRYGYGGYKFIPAITVAAVTVPVNVFVFLGLQHAVDFIIYHEINIGSVSCFMQRCDIVDKFPHYYFPLFYLF